MPQLEFHRRLQQFASDQFPLGEFGLVVIHPLHRFARLVGFQQRQIERMGGINRRHRQILGTGGRRRPGFSPRRSRDLVLLGFASGWLGIFRAGGKMHGSHCNTGHERHEADRPPCRFQREFPIKHRIPPPQLRRDKTRLGHAALSVVGQPALTVTDAPETRKPNRASDRSTGTVDIVLSKATKRSGPGGLKFRPGRRESLDTFLSLITWHAHRTRSGIPGRGCTGGLRPRRDAPNWGGRGP